MRAKTPATNSYLLEFLIDEKQVSLDDLKKSVAKALGRRAPLVDWKVTRGFSNHLKLSVKGPFEDLDACHQKLNSELVDEYSCVRLRDDAGEEIRQKAYPILARIEQKLRTFINRSMIEVWGFDWWDSTASLLTDQEVVGGVKRVGEQIGKASTIHHPLELALFDHLLLIVTSSIQGWPDSRSLSPGDLLDLLSDCTSIHELQEKLEEKIRKFSLWDKVFAGYFEEPKIWKELADTLRGFVIPARNKVMHHRPMCAKDVQRLEDIDRRVDELLASAVAELSEEQRTEARRASDELSQALRRPLAEAMLSAFQIDKSSFESLWIAQEAISRQLSQRMSQIAEASIAPLAETMADYATVQGESASAVFQQFQKQEEERLSTLTARLARLADLSGVSTDAAAYVGSSGGRKFHRSTCVYAKRIRSNNRIRLTSRGAALAKTRVPCEICEP